MYKVSRVDLVELIEKKSIIHTYKSPDSDTKMFRGKINFLIENQLKKILNVFKQFTLSTKNSIENFG